MESNRDEAQKCINIARKHLDSGNISSARKFCQKSIALFETAEAVKLLAVINAAGEEKPSASTSSATEEHPSAAGVKQRHTQAQGSSSNGSANGSAGTSEKKREYTPEQHAVVKRVMACKTTAYYEILAVEKTCEENDIKKAYRKLALALHPDKNGAPGADEAFKLVSKAFQVLSDSQKRTIYDQSGADPEDRFSGMSSSPGFSSFNGGGPMFESEISPEELFNMFFGGGGMGGMGGMGGTTFGTGFGGPGISFSFGPGRFTTTNMGGMGGQRFRQQNAAPTEPRSILIQLLPLLLLFAFSLLSALPNLFTTPPVPDPRFSFQSSTRFNVQRTTNGLGVDYHVNKGEFFSHPVIGAELAKQEAESSDKAATKQKGPGLMQFESNVDRAYTQEKYAECQRGMDRKQRDRDQEIGLLGIGTDWEKVKKIDERKVEACETLKKLNIIR